MSIASAVLLNGHVFENGRLYAMCNNLSTSETTAQVWGVVTYCMVTLSWCCTGYALLCTIQNWLYSQLGSHNRKGDDWTTLANMGLLLTSIDNCSTTALSFQEQFAGWQRWHDVVTH